MALIVNPGAGGVAPFTNGSIPFAVSGAFSENNANLRWDDATTTLYVNGVAFTPGKYSASTGASFVGFAPSGIGAVSNDIQSYLRLLKYAQGWIPTALWAGIAARSNTTDLVPYIQAAMDAVGVAGGGKLICPGPGDYLLHTATTSGGIAVCLSTKYDNVELHLEAGAVLKCDIDADVLGCGGFYKPGGITGWAAYNARESANYGGSPFTLYAINSATKYVPSVTLVTPGQSSNFQVGDWILIRTGQTLTTGTAQPFGEQNKISGINAGSGLLSLEFPLKASYVQENYPVGHAQAGNPAPFGIVNLTRPTNVILQNFKITGKGRIESLSTTTLRSVINGNQSEGRVIDGPEILTNSYPFSEGSSRSRMVNVRVHATGTGLCSVYSQDSCNHDWVLDDAILSSVGSASIHLHEGCSGKIGSGVTVISGTPVITTGNAISIRARSHDISIGDVKIYGFGADASTPGIYADTTTDRISLGNALIVGAVSANAPAVTISGTNSYVGLVNTETGVLVTPDVGNYVAGELTKFIAANDFNIHVGSPVFQLLGDPNNSGHWVFAMPNGSSTFISTFVRVPPYWKRAQIRLWFTNMSAGAGNVVMNASWRVRATGVTLNSGTDAGTGATIAAPSQWVLSVPAVLPGTITLADASELEILLQRNGVSGSDTLAGNIGLLGLELLRTY